MRCKSMKAEEHKKISVIIPCYNQASVLARSLQALAEQSRVRLQVFDLLGRELEMLLDGNLDAGSHAVAWDASDYAGGVYYYRLSAGANTSLRKMVLLK